MLHIIKAWKIEVRFKQEITPSLIFFINDDHYSNMLQKLREFNFGFNNDPEEVRISAKV